MTTAKRYPLSTINGVPIPLDVIRPSGVIRKAFLASGATTAEALPAGTEVIAVRTTQDCFIKFANEAAAKPVSASPSVEVQASVFLQAGEVQFLSPELLYYSVIGDIADGTLTIQLIESWNGVTLELQQSRI